MAGLNDMPKAAQVGLIVGLCLVIAVAAYFVVLKDMQTSNAKLRADVKQLQGENARIEAYLGPKEKELDRDMALLQQQIERQKQIVPDEKLSDKFMHMMTDRAAEAGVAIRRYEVQPTVTHDYYVEAPYAMELDGPFYAVLAFFERVKGMDRIVNVNNLQMASTRKPSDAKVKKSYKYSPTESVVSSFTAVTFYATEGPAPAQPGKAGAKPGKPATPAAKTK